MFIRLTNASPDYFDMPLALRAEMIVSVFETEVTRGEGEAETKELVTVVYSPQGSWEVQESVDEVLEMLNT